MNALNLLKPQWWREMLATKTAIGHPRDPGLAAYFAPTTIAGIVVNEQTALASTAVYAAISLISETIGQLPFPTYRRLRPHGKERAYDHHCYSLLHDQANDEMAAGTFRETLTAYALGWGNGYAEIERDGAARPIGLHPHLPNFVRPFRTRSKRFAYEFTYPDGTPPKTLDRDDVFHLKGLGDGIVGCSPIRRFMESIALTLATEQFGQSFFGNGSRPGGVIEHPNRMGPDAVMTLRNDWERIHQGVRNAHRVAVLEEGAKWHAIGIPPEEAQFLQTRKFQISEIARIYRVPLHMLAELDRSTNNNIEHQGLDFVTYSLCRWLVRWEQEARLKLFRRDERGEFFAEHLVAGLMRGDLKTRYEAYAIGRNWGWLCADDVCELENLNPLPNGQGKIYLVPGNMQLAQNVGKTPEPDPKPAPEVNPPPELRPRSFAEMGTIVDAHQELLGDVIGRMLRKETAAARRAAGKPAEFLSWLDEFYASHVKLVQGAVRPALATWHAVAQIDEDASQAAAQLAAAHVARSREELLAIAGEATAERLLHVLDTRLAAWESRPADQARQTISLSLAA